ncbi:unnamed protein product, partial [Iphiclides podalirius]
MMLTIHGLPTNIKYPNLKAIIQEECKISEFILGALAHDQDGMKKVRIGVADDKEGNIVMKCLDGYRLSGHVIRVVPLGRAANKIIQQNAYNDTSYEWRGNQQGSSYGNSAVEPVSNRSVPWTNTQVTTQWNPNQQTIPTQMQNQSNFAYVQPASAQPPFFQQNEPHQQNKTYGQHERFSQGRAVQPQAYGTPKERNVPVGNRTISSNLITPQRQSIQSRPHVLTNVEITDQPLNRAPVQGGRYSAQSYNNNDKPVTIMKEYFQGPSEYNVDPQSNQPQTHYQGQGYSQQWSATKQEPLAKHGASQYGRAPYNNRPAQGDKRPMGVHDPAKGPTGYGQHEKGGRGMSPEDLAPPKKLTRRREYVSLHARNFPFGSQDFSVWTEDLSTWAEDFAIWAEDFPIWAEDLSMWAEDFSIWKEDFSSRTEVFSIGTEDFSIWTKDLSIWAEDFPI